LTLRRESYAKSYFSNYSHKLAKRENSFVTIEVISQGEIVAKLNTLGSTLIGLTDQDFHLIEPETATDLYPGSILVPWPNRIRDGRYSYAQTNYQLPINEPVRSNALHGLVAYRDCEITNKRKNGLELDYVLDSPTIYPGKLDLSVIYQIQDKSLHVEISCKNIGSIPAPYGVSIHTYLVAGKATKNNQVSLKLLADQYLKVDSRRFLPTELSPCSNTEFDFRNLRQIGALFIDHAFRYQNGLAWQVELIDENGSGVILGFDSASNGIQIHTADRNGSSNSRKSLAVEPMSCPPDAFNSGVDLINLEPGDIHISKI